MDSCEWDDRFDDLNLFDEISLDIFDDTVAVDSLGSNFYEPKSKNVLQSLTEP